MGLSAFPVAMFVKAPADRKETWTEAVARAQRGNEKVFIQFTMAK